jgi:hypothetical protein
MVLRTNRWNWLKQMVWGVLAVLAVPAVAAAFFPPFNNFPLPPIQNPPVLPPVVEPPPATPELPPVVNPGGTPDPVVPPVVPPVSSQTPEPATIVGCLAGLAFLRAVSMRKRRQAN